MNPAEREREPAIDHATARATNRPIRVAEIRSSPPISSFAWRLARQVWKLKRDRTDPRDRGLASTYLRLKLRQRLLRRFPSWERKRERLLGLSIELFDYWTFVYLFEEIFVAETYRFECESDRPRIVDCGSNIGLSLLYFKHRHPRARILGFECDPETFELCERNVRKNALADVEVRSEALFPGRDRVTLYRDPNWRGAPFMSLDRRMVALSGSAAAEPAPSSQVRATALSPHLDGPVDFLKMDIEGVEAAVLEELSTSGKLGLVRQMVVEYHHHIAPPSSLSRVLGLLEQNGFGYQIRAGFD
ncbi:MAG: FkbM family methyltransferase, partial [Candidatus Binatia bacterium]